MSCKAVPTMGTGLLQPLVLQVSLDKVLESGFRTTFTFSLLLKLRIFKESYLNVPIFLLTAEEAISEYVSESKYIWFQFKPDLI